MRVVCAQVIHYWFADYVPGSILESFLLGAGGDEVCEAYISVAGLDQAAVRRDLASVGTGRAAVCMVATSPGSNPQGAATPTPPPPELTRLRVRSCVR